VTYLHVVAALAYANSGQPGYNAVVFEEIVSFKVMDQVYKFSDHMFVTPMRSPTDKKKIDVKVRGHGPIYQNTGVGPEIRANPDRHRPVIFY